MAGRTTRRELISDPRSGARPLPGTPGPGEDDDDENTTRPLPAAPASAEDDDEDQAGDGHDGGEDQAGEKAGESRPGAPGSAVTRQRIGHGVAGLITGLFLWGYAENWLRGGRDRANGWAKAKFINEPWAGAAKKKTTGKTTTAPGPVQAV